MNKFTMVLLAGVLAWSGAASARPAPPLAVNMQPGPIDSGAGTGSVGVTLSIPDATAPAGTALLALPLVVANVDTVATTLEALQADDDAGPLPLTVRDDVSAGATTRRWLAGRAVQGTVVVRYRAPIDNTPPARGAGPPYSLRTEGGGFSAVGSVFLLLPDNDKSYPIAINWDLSRLVRGATATSSYGDGNVLLPSGPAARLARTVFMAGPMHRVPGGPAAGGFSSAWLGETPFDPAPLMGWTQKLHGWMNAFFKADQATPYRVFLRYNPINAGGGSALTNSFLATYGTGVTADHLKGTLAHEMIHTWTSAPGAAWYSEGIAVYYQALLPLRAGLIGTDEYLLDINDTAARYYANALNDTPDAQIAARFWEDTRIRVLPYDRGAMYFVVVNAQLKKASGGQRSIDDLVHEMNRRLAAGEKSPEAIWRDMVKRELGQAGAAQYEAMLAGALMLPEAGDFGPCFTRTSKSMRRFELGFTPASLVGNVKTIRGLQPDSAAAAAGLKNGDVVTYAVAMDAVQSRPEARLTLKVTRDGKTFPLTYLPRGAQVDVWQWKRVAGIPDSACARSTP